MLHTLDAQRTISFERDAPPDRPALRNTLGHNEGPTVRGGGGNVLWSEDFGNGFPAGWTVQDASGICPWTWSLDGSYGYYNGNGGTMGGTAIASTTAANGFLIADNDSANNANFGQPSGTTYQYLDTRFTTSAIDLTGHPCVVLEFEQYFRYNNTPTLDVKVSTDQINWTTWEVTHGVAANNASPNVDLVQLNISAVAGDQPTVYIQIGWNARVYFWMIDDMRIVEGPQNDLTLTDAWYDEWFFDQADDFSTLEYSIYPSSQLRPLHFKGMAYGLGCADQTNVTLNVVVTDATNNIVTTSNAQLASVTALMSDSLYPTEWTPPANTENYTATFTLSADSMDTNPGDNVQVRSFGVRPHTFGRDRDSLTNSYERGNDPYELGNWFNVVNDGDMCYGIDVAIDDATPVGTIISAMLRDGNRDLIDVTEEHEVTAADLNAPGGNTFVTLPFSVPIPLDAGSDYLALALHYGGADTLWVGTSGISVPQTSLVHDVNADVWYYTTNTPMVRMDLDPSVGLNEVAERMDRVAGPYPNPASTTAAVTCELRTTDQVIVELADASGRTLSHMDLGRIPPGRHRIDIPIAGLDDGVYACMVITGDQRTTRRLVVHH
ncbi:MAG: T9SS type A sorting domain-containing protein [Flavobacteriales bacterium]|nr:T9SS type A sorting domain-containing protein [Flavobacteriales bacterium]MCB9193319.1 T9SS type A sorting domain-containing protein [Flavobacteriales bacterium]